MSATLASDQRRYGILDAELRDEFPSGYLGNLLARGIVPTDVFDSGLLPGFLACTRCNSGVMHPSIEGNGGGSVEHLSWWLVDGNVLVCLECGADLT